MSNVIPEAIMFIAVIVAAGGVAGAMTAIANDIANDARARGEQEAHDLASDITIINDPADIVTSPNLVVYVKNTGDTVLDATAMDLIVNGAVSEGLTIDVLGSTDDETWPAGVVVQVTVTDVSLGAGDHRVRATIGSSASDTLAWSV